MTVARGTLWFAPGRRMADVDLDDSAALIKVFADRVEGFFLEPARRLKAMEPEEASLFASALICGATIESLARFDTDLRHNKQLIADWLVANIPAFSQDFKGKSVAAYFEERFRNGLVHEGYVASLGRLGNLAELITIDRDVVTVSPFLLIEEISNWLRRFQDDLKSGRRDVRAFQHRLKELFKAETDRARSEEDG